MPGLWNIYWPTFALVIVTAIAVSYAVKTLRAIRDQVGEMQKSSKQTDTLIHEQVQQTNHMAMTVSEAGRSADAMNKIAETMAISADAAAQSVSAIRLQMRAYVTVIIGGAAFQERAKNIKFAGIPTVLNTGNTPAHKVRHKTAASILPVPLPKEFNFPLPGQWSGGNVIGPHQNNALTAVVPDFVDDAAVDDIKTGKGPSLYVWGVLSYNDAFGDAHETRFCQILTWLPTGQVWGYFLDTHNDAT